MIIFPSDEKTKLIRTMEKSAKDYTGIARCYNSFNDSDSWPEGFGGGFTFTEEWAKETYENDYLESYFVIVAPDDEDKIVGVCLVNRSWMLQNSWYVELLGVDPAYQGQKLGKTLLLKATEYTMEKGAKFISLHTWGGNNKALPLYKKQGYKWRPDTSVYMENFMPQILNFPLFKEFFEENSWYEIFQPRINYERDIENDEKMMIYSYEFYKNENNFLKVIIDRSIGMISGFHFRFKEMDLFLNANTPNSNCFIGIEEFPVRLYVRNDGKEEIKTDIVIKTSKSIRLDESENRELVLENKSDFKLELTGHVKQDAREIDFKTNPHSYTDQFVEFEITLKNMKFPLVVGIIPKTPLTLRTFPKNFVTNPDLDTIIPLEIRNYFDEDTNVKVLITDGKCVSFEKHEYEHTISKLDSTMSLPAKISSTESIVDYFEILIVSESGITIVQKKLPIIIFNGDRALSYDVEEEMFIENKNLRIKAFKNNQPMENAITIYDKNRNLQLTVNFGFLGYPMNEEGSEFFTKTLFHKISIEENGICLSSTTESTEKPGLEITRRFFVPNENTPLKIFHLLRNKSEIPLDNLGIRTQTYWWSNQAICKKTIRPFKEGIKHTNIDELGTHIENNPKLLAEGWIAVEYSEGYMGHIFDLDRIDEIVYGRFPNPEERIPILQPNELYKTSNYFLFFCDDWKTIRKNWFDLFKPKEKQKAEEYIESQDMLAVGIKKEEKDDSFVQGLILPQTHEQIITGIDAFGKTNFKGKLTLELPVSQENHTFDIKNDKPTRYSNNPLKKKYAGKNFESGNLQLDFGSRTYSFPLSFAYYSEKDEIEVRKIKHEKREYFEVDNGFLSFRGSHQYRGNVFHLSVEGSDNHLLTHYPEVKPFMWDGQYYGGIGGILYVTGSWYKEDYNDLNFHPIELEKEMWKGIGFQSEIITYDPALKGLQIQHNYYTLPKSSIILYEQEIKNHSQIIREFDTLFSAEFHTSKTDMDTYYTQVNGKIKQYFNQETESQVWRQKDSNTYWAAYKNLNQKHYFGAIADIDIPLLQNIHPYSPNLDYSTIGYRINKVKIRPNEKLRFRILYLLTENLNEIYPFVRNNLKDLL